MSDENVGRRAAEEAAAKARGAAVIPMMPGDWNDVHRKLGPAAVKGSVLAALEKAKMLTTRPEEYLAVVERVWNEGMPSGDKPGWRTLDPLYSVAPGMVTVITGWPGSGKSEFLDAMLVNLFENHGWKFAIHSPENQPIELHVIKLVEKVVRKPFGPGPTERVTKAEVACAIRELNKSFAFLHARDGSLSVSDIISDAAPALDQFGERRGLVIDPWNELEHWRPQGMSETEYVSQTLSLLRNWARVSGVHVWIVGHPQKMRRSDEGKLPTPRPDMISGSQHWWNKADACLTVERPFDENSQAVDIHVQKIRFKHLGRLGFAQLMYDRITGRYHDAPGDVRDF